MGALAIPVSLLGLCGGDKQPSPGQPRQEISGNCNAQGSGNSVTCQNIAAPPNRSDLKVVNVAVQKPSKVDAELQDEGRRNPPEKAQIEASVIDVTVKNSGTAPVVILGVDFTFAFAEEMQNCPGGGDGVMVGAAYSVKVPTSPPPRPFKLTRDIRFSVASGGVERFTLSVGPDQQYDANEGGPWLYVMGLALRTDDAPKTVDLGTVAIAAQPRMLIPKPYAGFDPDCLRQNLEVMAAAARFPAIRPEELTSAIKAYAAYTMPRR